MTKASKSLTLILTALLTVLTLFAGAFIPATVKAEEVSEEPETEIVSVLAPGVVSIIVTYKNDYGQTKWMDFYRIGKSDSVEDGLWVIDDEGVLFEYPLEGFVLTDIDLTIIVDLSGTAYEKCNSLTVELSNLFFSGETIINGEEVEVIANNWEEEDGRGIFVERAEPKGLLTNGFNATILNPGGYASTVYAEDVFPSYGDGPSDDYLKFEAFKPVRMHFSFDVKCYVEIDKDKIIEVDPEINGEGEPEDALENKAENWLNETGDKISSFIQENTGVAIGGTSSVVVLVIIAIIVIRKLKRR